MSQTFNGAAEPMRALRDLIVACESGLLISDDGDEEAVLQRARDGFSVLRMLFGDGRPAEDIQTAVMTEPKVASVSALIDALQMAAGALRAMENKSLVDPQEPVRFTGEWKAKFGTLHIGDILDHANMALEGA